MAATILGIEIGAATIKFAEVRGKTLVRPASYPLPDNLVRDGMITSADGLVETLEKINAIDFDALNKAIQDLSAVIEPLAKFFSAFR